MSKPTIGVFDSGFGGLTVLHSLLKLLPRARYVYLGDTARLPYGSKSRQTIVRYALESARFLEQQGADHLVVACNTATALALDEMRVALSIPVTGVIEPGARAVRDTLATGKDDKTAVVLATSATVQSHAYRRELGLLGIEATEKACPLLVPLVEEGWLTDPAHVSVTSEVLRLYLLEALAEAPRARALLLGCTHYPLLRGLMETTLTTLKHPMSIVDSAEATAQAVAALPGMEDVRLQAAGAETETVFYATDSIEKFERLGSVFLGRPVSGVKLLDLGG
jgi:glutamate racemase